MNIKTKKNILKKKDLCQKYVYNNISAINNCDIFIYLHQDGEISKEVLIEFGYAINRFLNNQEILMILIGKNIEDFSMYFNMNGIFVFESIEEFEKFLETHFNFVNQIKITQHIKLNKLKENNIFI